MAPRLNSFVSLRLMIRDVLPISNPCLTFIRVYTHNVFDSGDMAIPTVCQTMWHIKHLHFHSIPISNENRIYPVCVSRIPVVGLDTPFEHQASLSIQSDDVYDKSYGKPLRENHNSFH